MSQFFDTLFNTSHQLPSLPVILVLAAVAFVFPALQRYIAQRKDEERNKKNKK